MVHSGVTYCFSDYSQALKSKHSLGLTQEKMELVGSFMVVGGYVGLPAGLLYDTLSRHKRWGPKVVVYVGGFVCIVGYLGMYTLATRGGGKCSTWDLVLMCFLGFVGANSGTFLDTAAMASNLKNFSMDRGTVLGMLKSFLGLSAAIHTLSFDLFFSTKDSESLEPLEFLKYLAVVVPIAGIVGSVLVNEVPFPQQCEGIQAKWRRFLVPYGTVGTIALAITISSIVGSVVVPLSNTVKAALLVLAATGILQLFLLPAYSGGYVAKRRGVGSSAGGDPEAGSGLAKPLLQGGEGEGDAPVGAADSGGAVPDVAAEGDDSEVDPFLADEQSTDLLRSVRTPEFWLLFGISMASIGSGITLLNNLTQLCASVAPAGRDSVTEATALVKLFSIFNCAGRLVSGLVSQIYLKRGVARGWFMLLASLVMSLACLITAFAPLEVLYLPVVFAGFAFGSFWCLIPTITSEIFGTRYFATIYNTISVGPAIGSVVLSSLMAGSLYDLHSRAFPTGEFGPDGQPIYVQRCEGRQCFQATYLICSVIAFAGACASVILVRRTAKLYEMLHRAQVGYEA